MTLAVVSVSHDDIDVDDAESEAATEREMTLMWLADLESRVAWLEELLGVAPGLMGVESRVAELEALADYLHLAREARDRDYVQGRHRPLWERTDIV
jgi:hypothetical protein